MKNLNIFGLVVLQTAFLFFGCLGQNTISVLPALSNLSVNVCDSGVVVLNVNLATQVNEFEIELDAGNYIDFSDFFDESFAFDLVELSTSTSGNNVIRYYNSNGFQGSLQFSTRFRVLCDFLQSSNSILNSPVNQSFNLNLSSSGVLLHQFIGTNMNSGIIQIAFSRVVVNQSSFCNISYLGNGVFEQQIDIQNFGVPLDLNDPNVLLQLNFSISDPGIELQELLNAQGDLIGMFSGDQFSIGSNELNLINSVQNPGVFGSNETLTLLVRYFIPNSTGCVNFTTNLQLKWNCPGSLSSESCYFSPLVQCQLENIVEGALTHSSGVHGATNYCYGENHSMTYFFRLLNPGPSEAIASFTIKDNIHDYTTYDLQNAWVEYNGDTFPYTDFGSLVNDSLFFDNVAIQANEEFKVFWNIHTSCVPEQVEDCSGARKDLGRVYPYSYTAGCTNYNLPNPIYIFGGNSSSQSQSPNLIGNQQLMGNNSGSYTEPVSETFISFSAPTNTNNLWNGNGLNQAYMVKVEFCDLMGVFEHDFQNVQLTHNGNSFPLNSNFTSSSLNSTLGTLCSYSINNASANSFDIILPFGLMTIQTPTGPYQININRNEIANIGISLPLIPNCPGPGGNCPLTVSLFHIPNVFCNDEYAEGCNSNFCAIPVSCRTVNYSVLCPGCTMQGLYTNSLRLERLDFGFPDNNNDGYFESASIIDPASYAPPIRKNAVMYADRFKLDYKGVTELNNNFSPELIPGETFYDLLTNNGTEVAGFNYLYARVRFPNCFDYVAYNSMDGVHVKLKISQLNDSYEFEFPIADTNVFSISNSGTKEFIYDFSIDKINTKFPGILPQSFKYTDQTEIDIQYVFSIDNNFGLENLQSDILEKECAIRTYQYYGLREEDIFDPSDWLIYDESITCPTNFSLGIKTELGPEEIDSIQPITMFDLQNQTDGEYFEFNPTTGAVDTTGLSHLDNACNPQIYQTNPIYNCSYPLQGDEYGAYAENNTDYFGCPDLRYMCVPGESSFYVIGYDMSFGIPRNYLRNSCLLEMRTAVAPSHYQISMQQPELNSVTLGNRLNYALAKNAFPFEYRNWINFDTVSMEILSSNSNWSFIPSRSNYYYEYSNSPNAIGTNINTSNLSFNNDVILNSSQTAAYSPFNYVPASQGYSYNGIYSSPKGMDDTYTMSYTMPLVPSHCTNEDQINYTGLYRIVAKMHPEINGLHTTGNLSGGLNNQPLLVASGGQNYHQAGFINSNAHGRDGSIVEGDSSLREYIVLYENKVVNLPKLIWSAPIIDAVGVTGSVTWEVQAANVGIGADAPNPWVALEFPKWNGQDFWTGVEVYALTSPVQPSISSMNNYFNGFNISQGVHQMDPIFACDPCDSSNHYIFETNYEADLTADIGINLINGSVVSEATGTSYSNIRYRIVAQYDCGLIGPGQIDNSSLPSLKPHIFTGYACDTTPYTTPESADLFLDTLSSKLEYFVSNSCRHIDTLLPFTIIGSEFMVTADSSNSLLMCDTSEFSFNLSQFNGVGNIYNMYSIIESNSELPSGSFFVLNYLGETDTLEISGDTVYFNNSTILQSIDGVAILPPDNSITQNHAENQLHATLFIPSNCSMNSFSIEFFASPYCYNLGNNPFCGGENLICYTFNYDDANNSFLEYSFIDSALCIGDTIKINITGGCEPYTVEGLTLYEDDYYLIASDSGQYVFEITDNLGCSLIDTLQIFTPLEIDVDVSHVTCSFYQNGELQVNVEGGNGPYDISIFDSNMEIVENNGLSSGTYFVEVKDESFCSIKDSLVINSPSELDLTFAVVEPLCHGDTTGSISIAVNGGTQPYEFGWTQFPELDTFQLTNVLSGYYNVIVTDSNDCSIDTLIYISQPDPLIITALSSEILCFGDSTGSIHLDVAGGSGSYSYVWDDYQDLDDSIRVNLFAGTYNVSVSDSSNCSKDTTILITQPDELELNAIYSPAIFCLGDTVSLELEISGGLPDYSIYLNGGLSSSTSFNHVLVNTADSIEITVEDSSYCSFDTTLVLSASPLPEVTMLAQDICFGEVLNFNYSVSNLTDYTTSIFINDELYTQSQNELLNIGANIIHLTILSMQGCETTISDTFFVRESIHPIIVQTETEGCPTFCSQIEFQNMNEFQSIQFYLNDELLGDNIPIPLCIENPGTYQLNGVFVDHNNCQYSGEIGAIINVFTPPIADFLIDHMPSFYDDRLVLLNNSSENVIEWNWYVSNATPEAGSDENFVTSVNNIDNQTFEAWLIVIDVNGCSDTLGKVIKVNPELTIYAPNTFTPNNDNINQYWKPIISGLEIKSYNLKIFNRWGELIFESNDLDYGWNGFYNDQISQDGIYTWKISISEMKNANVLDFHGHINLLR